MSSSKRRIGTQYGLAIVSVAAVALLRWLLQPALADAAPLILFVLPIVICGWYGGIGPALLATTLGTLIGAYLFLPAGRAQHSLHLGDLPLIVSFFPVGVSFGFSLGVVLPPALYFSITSAVAFILSADIRMTAF